MIQLTDLTALQELRDEMSGLVASQQDNWDDEVSGRIIRTYLAPALQECDAMISEVSPGIREIVSIFGEMERLASSY